jgi:ketosteroid isomerase-like protein
MFERRVQHTFDAVSRKDLAAVMAGWAEYGVLEFPGRTVLSGRHEGKRAIEAFFREWFERMETIRLTVKHVGFAGLTMTHGSTMYVEFDTDQTTKDGIEFHTEVAGVYRFRQGKLAYYREYLFDPTMTETVWPTAGD